MPDQTPIIGTAPPLPRETEAVWLRGEQEAIRTVLLYGHRYGFGNLIGHLQEEWSQLLQTRERLSKDAADRGAWKVAPLYHDIEQLEEQLAMHQAALAALVNSPTVAGLAAGIRDEARKKHKLPGIVCPGSGKEELPVSPQSDPFAYACLVLGRQSS